jgi:ABC-2 type transport system permease protein
MRVALAIARRDLVRWFTNPAGYVFITIFMLVCAVFQFMLDRFFLDNLANLAPLNYWYPAIMVFFAPIVAMGTWADERRYGTDELLLTLPTPDVYLVLGKYLAALGIYAVSLVFSLGFIVVLGFLGRPDLGLMFGTYLGYALLGAALIAIAMIGSMLVESVTVGFILGVVFCAIPVGIGYAESFLGESISSFSVRGAFRDFTSGVVSLEGIVFFACLTTYGLAVNYDLIRQRRLRAGKGHLPVRRAVLLVSLVSVVVLAGRSGARIDVTSEQLHSLSPRTRETLRSLPENRPVFIQAYVSPKVPQDYVETRENLLGLLREMAALGGGRLHVRVTETTKASEAAREAEDRFRIRPIRMAEDEGGRSGKLEVFLGLAVTCGLDEVVVPFIYRKLSPEYEVARSIRAVINAKRARAGILSTEAKWFGGFDFNSMRPSQGWEIVEELKRQYEVVTLSPDAPIVDALDVLIVPMPSSLTQPQLDNLFAYVKQGKPTLFLDDPLPIENPPLGPNEMRRPPRGMMGGGAPPEPKGDARDFYHRLGLTWDPEDIVWDKYNPHPALEVPPELIFVGTGNGAPETFSPKSPVTSKLQELVFIFGGCLKSADVKGIEVTPLVHSGPSGGVLSYRKVWTSNPWSGGGLNPRRRYLPSVLPEGPLIAARAQGKSGDVAVDAIFIADLDFISEQFFYFHRMGLQGHANVEFDNVTFILNAVDALARDDAMIELRSRRPRHRTLERVEKATRDYEKKQLEEVRLAEEKADKQLDAAKERLNEAVKQIESRGDLDQQAKVIMVDAVRESEQRKHDVEKRRIEDDKEAAIARSEALRDSQVDAIRNRIKWMALLLPPVPAVLIAIFALIFRIRRELETRR